jgi:hypothetical protein
MSNGTSDTKTAPRKRASGYETNKKDPRFERISSSTSEIVKQAATLLDEEIAAGIVAARQMQTRFQRERRIDPEDFKDALARFRSDAHQVVTLINDQVSALRSEENGEIINRFTANAHSLLDVVVELVNMGAQAADDLVQQSSIGKKGADPVKPNATNKSRRR